MEVAHTGAWGKAGIHKCGDLTIDNVQSHAPLYPVVTQVGILCGTWTRSALAQLGNIPQVTKLSSGST